MKGILLHGGHGTRLRPLTHTGPKQLLPIANKPMSEYCIDSMRDAGIIEIAIIIGGIGTQKVIDYYGNGEKFGVKITYINQDFPKGIAHAISLCEEFIGNDKFLVFLGDNIIQKSIKNYVIEFEKNSINAIILLCEVDNPKRFGIAEIRNEEIIKILEKPENPPTNLAVTGIYFLTPKIFEIIRDLKPSWRNELEITDALQLLLEGDNKIVYHIITDYWKDTGTPDDIINANKEILKNMKAEFKGKMEENVTIVGDVIVGKGTVIKKECKLYGPTIIGDNCIIDENTIIGPNTSIGNNTKISKCIIQNSIIMENCTISNNLKINSSIISTNSKISKAVGDEKILLLGEGTNIQI